MVKQSRKCIELWTDGGCWNNGDRIGGIGVVMKYGDHIKEISEGYTDTTNNKMEMMAVIRGLESLKTTNIPIKIISDSAYVVNCFLQEWHINWRKNNWKTSSGKDVKNLELWIRMFELLDKQDSYEFLKVKGHVGVELNERADDLATEAIQRERLKQNSSLQKGDI